MDKETAKLKLLEVFSKNKLEITDVNDEIRKVFVSIMWRQIEEYCASAIREGKNSFAISRLSFNSYDIKIPYHLMNDVYSKVVDTLKSALDNSGIPYIMQDEPYGKLKQFFFQVSDLRKFSNVDNLGSLK